MQVALTGEEKKPIVESEVKMTYAFEPQPCCALTDFNETTVQAAIAKFKTNINAEIEEVILLLTFDVIDWQVLGFLTGEVDPAATKRIVDEMGMIDDS